MKFPKFPSHGPGPPRSQLLLYICYYLLVSSFLLIQAEHRYFNVTKLCQTHFLQTVYKKADGALVVSKNNRNYDCIMTFQTQSILQRFMVRFLRIKFGCNDHLFIYDGENPIEKEEKANFSCRNSTNSVSGVWFTSGNYLTLRYVTDRYSAEHNGFEMLLTAYKDQTMQPCLEFECTLKNFCISKDLTCDGITHCLDGSDEIAPAPCPYANNIVLWGMSARLLVPLILIIAMLVLMCIVLVFLYSRRHKSYRQTPSIHNSCVNFQMQNMQGANGNNIGIYCDNNTILTDIDGKYTPKPISENWLHPAGLKLGYSEVWALLYIQAW